MSIADLVLTNEKTWHHEYKIQEGINKIWHAMQGCVRRGLESEQSFLPGGLHLRRRARNLFRELDQERDQGHREMMDWVSLYAICGHCSFQRSCGSDSGGDALLPRHPK